MVLARRPFSYTNLLEVRKVDFSPTAYVLELARAAQRELGAVVDLQFERLRSTDEDQRTAAEAAVNTGVVRLLGFHAVNSPPSLPSEALKAAMVLQALVWRPGTQPELERELVSLGLANSSHVRDGLADVRPHGAC
jgi:hypothetical protein